MALVAGEPAEDISPPEDDSICTEDHCLYAFDTLYCNLTGETPIKVRFPNEKYPLFVSWHTKSPIQKWPILRGCIGTFEPQPVREGLAEYALISAFKDTRFPKIQERELTILQCSVSLLTNFEDASSYLDWKIGKHGIHITFPHNKALITTVESSTPSPLTTPRETPANYWHRKSYSATYLPEVPVEQMWDKRETIDSAIRKAGWYGRITDELRRSVKVRRYQSESYAVSWGEYIMWRDNHEQKIARSMGMDMRM